MPAEIYLNVAVSGLLTGLVYGLMALGLSVIFGVVRVVNFAHGEMMTIAMYLAVALFSAYKLDPLVMLVPIAAVLFALGYVLQREADDEECRRDRQHGHQRIELQCLEQQERRIHRDHGELAMSEVDDPHHTEDDR